MEGNVAINLPEAVLYRIVRGDAKGRIFGTPRSPNPPTITEFNPRFQDVLAGDLSKMIVGGKHGIFPESEKRIALLSNEELVRFRIADPISATQEAEGMSLTGGHHRINEIVRRVRLGQLDATTSVRILVHD